MEKIVILGMGGHAKSIIDAIKRQNLYEIIGYVVNETSINAEEKDYPVIGRDEDLQKLFQQGIQNVAFGIGFLGKSKVREKLYIQLKEIGYSFPIICDPSAIISKAVEIGEGTFIGKGAIINTGVRIGKMCIINTGSILEHGCQVDEFSHISVGTVLCGEVKVGKGTFIGANSTIIQGKKIDSNCIIGAGETIKKNIFERTEYRMNKDIITSRGGDIIKT